MVEPKITRLEVHRFQFEVADTAAEEGRPVYTTDGRSSPCTQSSTITYRKLRGGGPVGDFVKRR
jgi:hypothetical protein